MKNHLRRFQMCAKIDPLEVNTRDKPIRFGGQVAFKRHHIDGGAESRRSARLPGAEKDSPVTKGRQVAADRSTARKCW